MKKISKFMGICFVAFAIVSIVSCGSSINKEELDKKVQKSMVSDDELEFSDAEYQFMADYLCDSFDNFEKNGEEGMKGNAPETNSSYLFILMMADAQGKLSKEAKQKFELLQKKLTSTDEYQNAKAAERVVQESLRNADIDWEQVFEAEETEAPVVEEVVEEY